MQQLHHEILLCFNLFKHRINPDISQLDILPGQSKILQCLLNHPSTPKEVGDYCKIDKSTTTSLINKMEKMGYIEKEPSLSDKRSFVLHLTPLGKVKAEQSMMICDKVNDLALKDLSDKEKEQLFILLDKIKKNLEDDMHE